MDNAKSQLVDRLKTANSVLITVSRNPSVDQLAACIGLTLIVNKLGKHGSAVFSGNVPSTIEFLKPEETIEKTADSLRDFIIALDKNKADKLRYKVEDKVVKIFITPYRTSLSDKDLEFSQGDFNVELVVALGVKQQEDLDQAITSHGRILHDATVACVNTKDKSDLGAINWQDPAASSLCELITDLALQLGDKVLDEQISTALLTGIIAETNRFSNEKTSSQTMNVSGELMAAGANQQLVAVSLAEPVANLKTAMPAAEGQGAQNDDGTLNINHDGDLEVLNQPQPPAPASQPVAEQEDERIVTEHRTPLGAPPADLSDAAPRIITQAPTLGGTLTANSVPEQYDPSIDPLSGAMPPTQQSYTPPQETAPPAGPQAVVTPPQPTYTPPPPTWTPPPVPEPVSAALPPAAPPQPVAPIDTGPHEDQTITDLERTVNSPHLRMTEPAEEAAPAPLPPPVPEPVSAALPPAAPEASAIDSAREQIDAIQAETPAPSDAPEPDLALNALPLGNPLHDNPAPLPAPQAPVSNTTGLDPSLFSEAPTDKAPPVAPPLPLNLPTDTPTEDTAPKIG
ncbi:MAG: hypothetical protein WDN66_02175 [Candidatus Saccharibacteria bacterium]